MSRKSRARRRRQAVSKAERVKPSPLAEAKKRPWVMQSLLQLGPDKGGTSAEQHEAAIEAVQAYTALTAALGYRPTTFDGTIARGWSSDLGNQQLRLVMVYLRWATDLQQRRRVRGHIVVEWVNGDRFMGRVDVPVLLSALDLWLAIRDDRDGGLLTSNRNRVLTSRVGCIAATTGDA